MRIKHVSFDVWNTLVTPNPHFNAARLQVIAEVLNCTVEDASEYCKKVKEDLALRPGDGHSMSTVYTRLRNMRYAPHAADHQAKTYVMIGRIERLFALYPPCLTEEALVAINWLRKVENVTISLGSNTTFISGAWMHTFLQQATKNAFAFGVYSDTEGFSKPHLQFYAAIERNATEPTGATDGFIRRKNILHVGDRLKEDVDGPEHYGFQSACVSDPDKIFTVIFTALMEANHD